MTARNRKTEANKNFVRQIPTEIFDEGNTDLVDDLFSDGFVGHAPPTPGELYGPEGFKGLVTAFRTGFPDWLTPRPASSARATGLSPT